MDRHRASGDNRLNIDFQNGDELVDLLTRLRFSLLVELLRLERSKLHVSPVGYSECPRNGTLRYTWVYHLRAYHVSRRV